MERGSEYYVQGSGYLANSQNLNFWMKVKVQAPFPVYIFKQFVLGYRKDVTEFYQSSKQQKNNFKSIAV